MLEDTIYCVIEEIINLRLAVLMDYQSEANIPIKYRDFLLFEESNNTWKIQPAKSPMLLIPFKTQACSLEEAKRILDIKLATEKNAILQIA